MTKYIRSIITLLTITLFSDCNKDGTIAWLKGDVYYTGTNIPVQGAEINIYQDLNSKRTRHKGTGLTDQNGHFDFSYHKHFLPGFHERISVAKDSLFTFITLHSGKHKLKIQL